MHVFDPSPVLSRLSLAAQRALHQGSVLRRVDKGTVLTVGGDRSERVHLVVDGVVKLLICDAAGEESLAGLALEGDLLGDVSALDGEPEPYDAIAATETTLLGLDRVAFLDIVSADPRAMLEMATGMATKVRAFGAAASERGSRLAEARLAGRLLELANVVGRMRGGTIELDFALCQRDLGRLSGMSRESACRTLGRLKKEGVLDYSAGHFRIFRPDVLERIRCGERAARPSRSRAEAANRRSRSA